MGSLPRGRVTRRSVTVGGQPVSVRVVAPPQASEHALQGTALVPPLIGGSGMQQVGYFRALNRRGYALATFDYRGHGKSGGSFSIERSLEDTLAVLDALAGEVRAPLFGVADCYGCIPLLVAARERPSAFRALALFNPIPSLQYVATPGELYRRYFSAGGRNPFDLLGILAETNRVLFPGIDKSREHFGILSFDRVERRRAIWEYLTLDPLRGLTTELPTVLTYGRSDGILRLGDPGSEAKFLAAWARHLPRAETRVLDEVDHYWTGIQARASDVAAEFFARVRATAEPRVDAGTLVPQRPPSAIPATCRTGTTSSVA